MITDGRVTDRATDGMRLADLEDRACYHCDGVEDWLFDAEAAEGVDIEPWYDDADDEFRGAEPTITDRLAKALVMTDGPWWVNLDGSAR